MVVLFRVWTGLNKLRADHTFRNKWLVLHKKSDNRLPTGFFFEIFRHQRIWKPNRVRNYRTDLSRDFVFSISKFNSLSLQTPRTHRKHTYLLTDRNVFLDKFQFCSSTVKHEEGIVLYSNASPGIKNSRDPRTILYRWQ